MTSARLSEHYHKLERMYLSAPFNKILRPTIEITKGRSVIGFGVDERFFHAAGALHGSIYFKALDDAAYFAVGSLVKDVFVLTVSFTIYFTRGVSEGIMRAEGQVTSKSPSLYVAESVLYIGVDRQIARGSGTFTRSKIQLTDTIGYA